MSSGVKGTLAPGAFSPFAHTAFALLWTATLISNVGTWMHDVGAGWLMTTLDPSPSVVTLVQAATTLPVFLFALFAGALADRLDKRRMLIVINGLLTIVISVLTLLVWQGRMTPLLLILFTLAIGTGAAFMAPAWQAIVPQLVPREKLKPAIALNSMGVNISRAIGPAVAGVLIATGGLAAPFALNAASHIVIIAALLLWRPEPMPARYRGPILGDMAIGLRHARYNSAMQATVIRAAAFFVFASAYWALLPLIAREAEGGGSAFYGLLMGLIGAGAVTGALVLPRLPAFVTTDLAARIGSLGTILALTILAASADPAALMVACFLGGLSWITVLTSFNVSAQTALPDWVRARGLAVYLMVFFGSMALGSVTWGQVATWASTSVALSLAAAGLALSVLATRRALLGGAEGADLSPEGLWPDAPTLRDGQVASRPAMVIVEYRVSPKNEGEFLRALYAVSRERMRDGATKWFVHQSIDTPDIWVETFLLPSWSEHLEQHNRVTRQDTELHRRLRDFDQSPLVRHFVSPEV